MYSLIIGSILIILGTGVFFGVSNHLINETQDSGDSSELRAFAASVGIILFGVTQVLEYSSIIASIELLILSSLIFYSFLKSKKGGISIQSYRSRLIILGILCFVISTSILYFELYT